MVYSYYILIVTIHISIVDEEICKLNDDNTMYMWHCSLAHISA
jgi:hypothetical protein